MKILHISKYYFPYNGGIEDVACNMVKILKKTNQQVVVCFNDEPFDKVDYIDEIKVIRVGVQIKFSSQPVNFFIYNKLKKYIKDFEPDFIHFHAPNPLLGLFLPFIINKKLKLVVHWHGDIEKRIKLYALYKPFEKLLLKKAEKIIITSPNYTKFSPPLEKHVDKIEVIPNIVNLSKLTLSQDDNDGVVNIKEKYGERIIFTFGRHVSYKGFEYLLKAEKYIKGDCCIVIAGDGPLTKSLIEKKQSSRIHFVGRLSDSELRQYLKASYIFAFPSISRGEAFGVALAEAMFFGLPAITFTIDGSGVNWVNLKNLTGLEVKNGDYISYAQSIDKLFENKTMYDMFSKNAKDRVLNNFTIDKITEKVLLLYANI